MKILLASNSPRRKELLAGLDIDFEVKVLKGIDESYPSSLTGGDIPLYIAEKKAAAYEALLDDDTLIITADTIVWLDGEVLGKPADEAEACNMLRKLSGKTHQVFTGVCLLSKQLKESFSCQSDVTFCTLSDEQIAYYVNKYKPLDKAGAYGVQEWIGYVGVERIEGSYFNVMGLPVQRLSKALNKVFNIGTR